ncbi:MFS transporter [Streptomyces sp. NPDC048191]|uniref:MFS transporter n=1 Tax=Streptomyces sp. NPDC048191 TaxID=3155484 RepID=UPI0034089B2B
MLQARGARIEPRWWIAIISSGAFALCYLDQEAVTVALPSIQRYLHSSSTQLQLIVTAYLVALAAFISLAGRAADIVGYRLVFRTGVIIFVAASAMCGFSHTVTEVIVGRFVQGMGAAMMIPSATAAVIAAFEHRSRGRALSFTVAISMVFLAVGPLIGGLCIHFFSWRSVFLLNLPLGMALMALMALVSPPERLAPAARLQQRIDWVGALLLLLGLAAFLLGILQIQQWGLRSPTVEALLVSGFVGLALLVVWELRNTNPIVDLRCLTLPRFPLLLVVVSTIRFSVVGFSVLSAIWTQDVLGLGPIAAGLSLAPFLITLLLVTPLSGILYDRVGPARLVPLGTTAVAVSLLWMAAILHLYSYPQMIAPYVLMGFGLGLAVSPAVTDLLNAVSEDRRAEASGFVQTAREVSGAAGLAVMGAIAANAQWDRTQHLPQNADVTDAASPRIDGMGMSLHSLPQLKNAVTAPISTSFCVAGGLTLLTALLAFWRLRSSPPPVIRDFPRSAKRGARM